MYRALAPGSRSRQAEWSGFCASDSGRRLPSWVIGGVLFGVFSGIVLLLNVFHALPIPERLAATSPSTKAWSE